MDDLPADLGKLCLRLVLGLMVLQHGIAKALGGVDGIEGMLTEVGLPPAIAYGVYVGEILAPLMVIFGVAARVGAGLIVVNMLFAVLLAHMGELLILDKDGYWPLELQAMFLFSALALALLGSGRVAIKAD